MIRILILMCFFGMLSHSAEAQCMLVENIPISKRVENAEWIVEGKIIEKRSFWNDEQNYIYTSHLIEITKSFKGDLEGVRYVEMLTSGGRMEKRMLHTNPSLELNLDDLGIFFGYPLKNVSAITKKASKTSVPMGYGEPFNFIRYASDQGTASDELNAFTSIDFVQKTVVQEMGKPFKVVRNLDIQTQPTVQSAAHSNASLAMAPVITSFSPSTIIAGSGALLTINGSGFGSTRSSSTVSFHDPNNNDSPTNFIAAATAWEYGDAGSGTPASGATWSNTQIKIRIPHRAGTGTIKVTVAGMSVESASSVTINSTVSTVPDGSYRFNYGVMDDNGVGGYTFDYNTNSAGNGVNFNQATYKDPFERALYAWKNDDSGDCSGSPPPNCTYDANSPGYNWKSGTGVSINTRTYDNKNVIMFENDSNTIGGALAVTDTWWGWWEDDKYLLEEVDMVIRRPSGMPAGYSWNFSASAPSTLQYDFQSVVLHELGHAGAINHIINSSDVLHWAMPNGTMRRTISASNKSASTSSMQLCDQTYWDGQGYDCMLNSITGARGALPVEFGEFVARLDGNDIVIDWTTLSESNNDGFEVQSRLGVDTKAPYKVLGWVKGNGTTSQTQRYQYRVKDAIAGKHTFRLKQVDFDRSSKLSKEIPILIEAAGTHAVTGLFPNPFNPSSSFYVSVPQAQKVKIEVFNQIGQKVGDLFTGNLLANDIKEFKFDASDLATGLYLIRIQGETFSETLRATFMK